MTKEEALKRLEYHQKLDLGNDASIDIERSFIAQLEPYRGLKDSHFHDIVNCLRILADDFQEDKLNHNLIKTVFGIIHLARDYALHPMSIPQTNHYISKAETEQLTEWLSQIELIVWHLLSGSDKAFAFQFYEYYVRQNRKRELHSIIKNKDSQLQADFLSTFNIVFHTDWEYTKSMMGVMDKGAGTFLEDTSTFQHWNDWSNRDDLLTVFEELKKGITAEYLAEFILCFEDVFHHDWEYTKTQLQVHELKSGLSGVLDNIDMEGTFLNPGIADETEDWGYRGMLLEQYRRLVSHKK